MKWRYRKIKYDILIPNLDKNICQLSEKEAEAYFLWFMERLPERVEYVSKVCAEGLGIPREQMDLSPESLVLLWKWFRKRAKTEKVPCVRKENGGRKFPDNVWKNDRQLTLETEYILRDVGMYFGETFQKNIPQVCWSYYTKPKRDFFVNRPLLKGFVDRSFDKPFDACLEPIHYAGVQASRILKNTSKDTDLLGIYRIWEERV